jgi:hypothetical protein
MSKNKILVLVILIIAVLGFAYYSFTHKQAETPIAVTPEANVPTPEPQGEVCYFKQTTGGEFEGTVIMDTAFTSVNYGGEGKVHGIINWIPGEKDSLVGTYMGMMEPNVVKGEVVAGYPTRLNILYTASGEGIVNRQQEILVVGPNDIKTGIGEKYQDTDGIFKFRDINTLTYENALPKVDCASVEARFKADYSKAQ